MAADDRTPGVEWWTAAEREAVRYGGERWGNTAACLRAALEGDR